MRLHFYVGCDLSSEKADLNFESKDGGKKITGLSVTLQKKTIIASIHCKVQARVHWLFLYESIWSPFWIFLRCAVSCSFATRNEDIRRQSGMIKPIAKLWNTPKKKMNVATEVIVCVCDDDADDADADLQRV